MSGSVGLWIDHREAIIVTIDDSGQETVQCIKSGVERKTRLSGGSRGRSPYGPQDVAKEQTRDHRFQRQLDEYYERLIEYLEEAESIWIFGPGEAKTELAKKVKKIKSMADKLSGTESADKMTKPQIAARVREHYKVANRVSS